MYYQFQVLCQLLMYKSDGIWSHCDFSWEVDSSLQSNADETTTNLLCARR